MLLDEGVSSQLNLVGNSLSFNSALSDYRSRVSQKGRYSTKRDGEEELTCEDSVLADFTESSRAGGIET